MDSHPYRPFAPGSRIPVRDRLRAITGAEAAGSGWRYTLDNGIRITHEAVVEGITRNALFDKGQVVFMGRNGWRTVVQRKWSFRHGITFYRVADPRRNVASGWLSEDRMLAFTTGYPVSPVPDDPPAGEPPPDPGFPCDWL